MNETARQGSLPVRSEADRLRLQRMFAVHHGMVWRISRRRGLGETAAAEVTQEAFLAAAERLASIEPRCERAFFVGTALRSARTVKSRSSTLHVVPDTRGLDAGDERAERELVDFLLAQLGADLSEAFILYEIEGISSNEVAALLEMSLPNVAQRLRRAREQFRVAIARFDPDSTQTNAPTGRLDARVPARLRAVGATELERRVLCAASERPPRKVSQGMAAAVGISTPVLLAAPVVQQKSVGLPARTWGSIPVRWVSGAFAVLAVGAAALHWWQ